ncbi:MAG TPA: putative nucleotidyltransferase substrate binding domain-containing protein [Desulfuromonadaceae bacterium]|jgi:signal-transduction protein with cAMP-binding, CBS, and nucleotidyltransferase domain
MDISVAENILKRLPDLTRITRYCEPGEIGFFLRSIKAKLAEDRQKMLAWSQEHIELLEQVDQADQDRLRLIHEELNRIEVERFLDSNSVAALHLSCTHYRDAIATRALTLVKAEMEAIGTPLPDLPFALISMGSDGREEQTLITDQDYLIVYGDGGGEAADHCFYDFSVLLVERLEEAGFKKCTGDIMPTNPTWRGSLSQWRKRLLSIVRYEFEDYAKNMMDLIVLSDARYVAGDKQLADSLVSLIRGMEQDYFQVLWGMAKAATEMKLALGFMKRLWTESSGEHKGEFNIKLLAWAPLVMNVRILSINQGVPATNTIERIALLEKEGSFSATVSRELQDAYFVLTKHRILLQINVIKGIEKEAYYLNPYKLSSDEREQVRQAILRIEELQKNIHTNFSIV